MVQLDKDKLLAFVTRKGSINSHTAILARAMNIPGLMGVDLKEEWDGKQAIVDGHSGRLYLEPDQEILYEMERKQKDDSKNRKLLSKLRGKETITLDGRRIHICANIRAVSDISSVLLNDADGIGLFRSEFLYLERSSYPTEEEQFQVYKTVALAMEGKKVIIRTFDMGADKQADYFGLEKEENPAMGYRGIRICLDRVDIFKTQLRAIYRASAFGTISILFPMIISVGEVLRIKEIAEEVKKELALQNLSFKEVELGIMIETPAAVMISEELAREAAFLSIGTNDLTQYTLAIDRQNSRLAEYYDARHPAILKMIKMVVDNGHKYGCRVGICGELGADSELTEEFLRMGMDELSVSPSLILELRSRVRSIDLTK